jgi:hypothetical protein
VAVMILKLSKYSLLIILLAVTLILMLEKNTAIYEAPLLAIAVSIPLIINYFLLLPFKSFKDDLMFVGFWSIGCTFIVNLVIAIYFIQLYGQALFHDGTIGEGGAYWLLFTFGGALKFSLVGILIGAFVSSLYLIYMKIVNKSAN